MRLFNVLPDKLFSILSAPNKEIYVEALFVLYRAYNEEFIINKSDLLSKIIAELEDKIMNIDIEEEEDVCIEKNLSGMAHFLLRKLENSGWIEKELDSKSFDEYITIPEYSIKLIRTLYDIIDDRPKEYNSYVYSTYSSLKTANIERDTHTYSALIQANKAANDLVHELKTLLNNIRRYHQSLSKQESVQEILIDHFDEFKEFVADKIYHPLKTLDSVPRYKNPILKILKDWMMDEELKEIMVETSMVRKHFEDKEKARQKITAMIGEIIDIYEKIEDIIEEIDKKNSAYTRASTEKLRYLLNVDKGVKGNLINILKQSQDNDCIFEMIEQSVNAFIQGFIDEDSLYTPPKKREKLKPEPLRVKSDIDEQNIKRELEDFVKRAKQVHSHKKIMDFMKLQFANRRYIYASDLNIKNNEDFILLILGVIKHDEKVFYEIDFLKGYTYINGYRIPKMKLINKAGG